MFSLPYRSVCAPSSQPVAKPLSYADDIDDVLQNELEL